MSPNNERSATTTVRPRLHIDNKSDSAKLWLQQTHVSPNLQPPSPPILAPSVSSNVELPLIFGDKYLLVEPIETSNLYRCVDTQTSDEFCCKIVATKNYHQFLLGHLRMDGHSAINRVEKVLVAKEHTYVLFAPSYGDLHSYVRSKRRLRESEAIHLFHQIASIVADCHKNGIILRDLKLRKFIFANKEKTQLKLETLEDALVLNDDDDDMLTDKHGCPAYVSPEILSTERGQYSARLADCWSLGVILYTMLVGRYPFHDTNPSVLFCKIRRGTYVIPDSLSSNAKCLIKSLMRLEPSERLTAEDALCHRWFKNYRSVNNCKYNKATSLSQTMATTAPSSPSSSTWNLFKAVHESDQTVPDLIDTEPDADDSSLSQSMAPDI